MIRSRLVFVLFIIIIFMPGYSFANTALERGINAAKGGQWKIATSEFMKAWSEEPLSPVVLYNIGLAHSKSGNPLSAIAWLEAYLEAEPNSTNKDQIRNTISNLEMQTKASMANLFEKNLEIFKHVPLEGDYKWYSGKHKDADYIVSYLASVGKIKRANEVLTLSREYAKKIGGQSALDKNSWSSMTSEMINNSYAYSLATSGNLSEALKQAESERTLRDVLSGALRSTFSSISAIQQALKAGNEYSPDTIAIVARRLWLKGDVTGLKSLVDWLKDKNENYYPAMVEVASGLFGLGFEESAIDFARLLPKTWKNPAARYAIRVLYENPDLGSLNCYEREIGRSTLWRMLETRHLALKGKSEKIYSGTSIAMDQRRAHGKLITNDMKSDHAWHKAFKQYAGGNINEAKSIMIDAEQDAASFLIIALRNAATRDPLYAAEIASFIEPAYLGPFILFESAMLAENQGDMARANILKIEAVKRNTMLGGTNKISPSNNALREWINLGVLYSKHNIISNLSDILKDISSRKPISFEVQRLDVPFVYDQHNYSCPPKPQDRADPVAMVTAMESAPIVNVSDLSHAASFIGVGMLQIQALRLKQNNNKY